RSRAGRCADRHRTPRNAIGRTPHSPHPCLPGGKGDVMRERRVPRTDFLAYRQRRRGWTATSSRQKRRWGDPFRCLEYTSGEYPSRLMEELASEKQAVSLRVRVRLHTGPPTIDLPGG